MSKYIPGINDIATLKPELIKEWDYDRNAPLKPQDVAAHSNKKYWWKCDKGHSWEASPNNRANGNGCPYCSGHRVWKGYNDLKSLFPEICKEWDYKKNEGLDPSSVSAGSNISVWWVCDKGHSWKEQICKRIRGDGCPFCSGHRVWKGFNDLETLNPNLAKEWNYKKNHGLTPSEVTVSSGKKVWWKCINGHEWKATIAHRNLDNIGCPYCSGRYPISGKTDLATKNPVLAKEWHPTKNGLLRPSDVTEKSEKKVWWKCPICGNEWQATPAARSRGNGCQKCNKRNRTSFPEQAIYFYIKQYFLDAINSYTDIFDNGMELDVYIPSLNIGIEYDGIAHRGKKSDGYKYQICKSKGIKLIRISEIERTFSDICDHVIFSHYRHASEGGLDRTIIELLNYLDIKHPIVNVQSDTASIYSQYLTRLKDNSLEEKYPNLASEWHPTKNGDLLPAMFNWGTAQKVWWLCPKCGNEWQASIVSRSRGGSGCPICGREKVKRGQILAKLKKGQCTLFEVHPELKSEWDFEKNKDIDLSMITPHSNLKVWWKCAKGHEWQATISSRAYGTGCPYCSGQKVVAGETDLETVMPDLVKLWNTEKNGILKPSDVSPHSNKKVWWKCDNGHEWRATISSVADGKRCPYCSGRAVLPGFNDLEHLRPDLMKEWDFEKNGNLLPSQVTEHSGKKAWWRCSNGHEWYAVIDNRSKGHGCPICARNKRSNKKQK